MNGTDCVVIDRHKKYRMTHEIEHLCFFCGKGFRRFCQRKGTFCSTKCQGNYLRGRRLDKERRKKISDGLRNSIKYKEGIVNRPKIINSGCWKKGQLAGEKHPFWKGGISEFSASFRKTYKYQTWRKAVLERDNYTCQICGYSGGSGVGNWIEVDHIKPWSTFPDGRYLLANGRVLCHSCHQKTETYGGRARRVFVYV